MIRPCWHSLLWSLIAFALFLAPRPARAQETIPPKPTRYFNDYAAVVPPAAADDLNRQLEQFERDTSNQIRVVVYPKMQSDSSIEEYTVHVAQAWHIGMKGKDNGTILFVFIQDKKAYIQVGYGLEGALTDATCKQIIDESLAPNFKMGNYEAGLRAAVAGILAATKGEFQGTGRTADDPSLRRIVVWVISAIALFLLFGLFLFIIHNCGGTFYQHHVRSLSFAENAYMFFFNISFNLILSALSGSSSSSSGGSSGGGFSSSGGGSFGGGGAGGSW